MEKIRNIIFDLGGVIADLDHQRCSAAFGKLGLKNVDAVLSHPKVIDRMNALELGEINRQAFCEAFRQISGSVSTDEEIVSAWNSFIAGIPDERKVRLLALRKSYRLFLLSNTNDMHWDYCVHELFPYEQFGVEDYFEQVFLSFKMHLSKPSEQIFREVLQQAAIVPGQTLFIDDLAENCAAAERVGIKTFRNMHPNDWLTLHL